MLDLCDGDADAVTRLFADLGADVLKVEPPGGSAARAELPSVAGASVAFALNNANKRSAVLDPADAADRDRFIDLAAAADIVVDSGNPGAAAAFGTSCAELPQRFAHLVAMSVTDFGADGPRRPGAPPTRCSTRCRRRCRGQGRQPDVRCCRPNGIASATAAVQAAWAALVAYYHRLRYGTGDYIDFSRFEAVVQSLDPPFGSEGQAAVGQKRSSELWRGRPRNQQIYPTFALQGRLRQDLPAVGTPMARNAGVAGGTGAVRRSQVRHDRRAVRRVPGDQRRSSPSCSPRRRWTTGARRGSRGGCRSPRCSARQKPWLRALPVGRRADRRDASRRAWTSPSRSGPFVVDGRHAGLARPAPTAGADEPAWSTPRSDPRADPTPRARTGRSTVCGFWISA